MSNIQKAISLAIEKGGYKDIDTSWYGKASPEAIESFRRHILVAIPKEVNLFLDPLFWQALGKALGKGSIGLFKEPQHLEIMEWHYLWHDFIDHLIEQKDPEDFFKELLTQSK